MEEGNCTFCGKSAKAEIYTQARLGGDSFTYSRCSVCGLIFLNPRPDAKEILKFYSDEYYGEGTRKFRKWLEAPRKYFAYKRIQRVQQFFTQPGRALDIGCGQGTFLQMLKSKGWECYGTELTADISSRAAQFGISVSVGEIQEGQFPDSSLDLVTFWHVLEHVEDPSKVLRTLRPMLKGKGIVAISTPNIDSLQARISGSRWFHLDPPRHLYLFSPKTLLPLMESLGFSLLKLRFLSVEQNPFGWLQSLLNLMGFSENGLYSILKNTPVTRKKRLSFWARGLTLLMAAGLFPACLLLSLSLDHFGWGGTMEAYFAKRIEFTDPSLTPGRECARDNLSHFPREGVFRIIWRIAPAVAFQLCRLLNHFLKLNPSILTKDILHSVASSEDSGGKNQKQPEISVVIPIFNKKENLPVLLHLLTNN